MIDKWTRRKKQKKFRKYKLLYRASKDGFGMQAFHAKCANKGETLAICQTTTNNVFGGFRSLPFENKGGNGPDPKAFIYLIRSQMKHKKPEIFECTNAQYAIYNYAVTSAGVMIGFGGGHDIGIQCDANVKNNSYANKHSYNSPSTHHLN